MGCNNKGYGENCVRNVVSEIIAEQDKINNNNDGCCTTSCDRAIDQLRGNGNGNGNGNGPNTVPFMLYCKGDCSPFIASGVYQAPVGDNGNTFFGCVETPVLRAKEFVDEDECCVRVELLEPLSGEGPPLDGNGGNGDVCDFFPGNSIREFQATGICLTLDLDCFCGIQCIDAVTPRPSSEFPNNNNS